MKKIVLVALALICFEASAHDAPLNGKDSITHNYNCIGVSTGKTAAITVQEFPGGANQIIVAQNTTKPITMTLTALDDQTRVARLYEIKAPNGEKEILEVSDSTGLATTTMLHAMGLEAFTSLVCDIDK